MNLVVGDDCIYGLGRRQKKDKNILFQVGAEDGIVKHFEVELEPEISVRAACIDSSGNLHILLSQWSYSEWNLGEKGAFWETISLTLVSFEESRELTEQVNLFNEIHEGYRIDIQIYQQEDADEDDRIERLQREIAAGRGPDLINYGAHYASNYCLGHYTENLLSYLSEDWQSIYFSNILKSFFLDGGLYAIPVGFSLSTFAGRQDMLGNRERWSIQVYTEREEGVILYPGETKADVFWRILSNNME